MSTMRTRWLASFFVVTAITMAVGTVETSAQQPYLQPRLRPTNSTPKLGVQLRFNGRGLQVDRVFSGSEARRLGIEVGDAIVAVDGRYMNHNGAFGDAVRDAMWGGSNVYSSQPNMRLQPESQRPINAWVTLTIRDKWTGRYATRTTNLANWRY